MLSHTHVIAHVTHHKVESSSTSHNKSPAVLFTSTHRGYHNSHQITSSHDKVISPLHRWNIQMSEIDHGGKVRRETGNLIVPQISTNKYSHFCSWTWSCDKSVPLDEYFPIALWHRILETPTNEKREISLPRLLLAGSGSRHRHLRRTNLVQWCDVI